MPEGNTLSFLSTVAFAFLGLAPRRAQGKVKPKAATLREGFGERLVVPELPGLAVASARPPAAAECVPEPVSVPAQRTPPPISQRTPSAPLRTLRWYEAPDLTAERVIELGQDAEPPLDERHDVATHASRLMFHILDPRQNMMLDDPPIARGSIERGLFAFQAETAYYHMCFQFGWRPHRWKDAGGVAEHFRKLLLVEPRYRWCADADGALHKQTFYRLPASRLSLGKRPGARPKRTPQTARGAMKRTPKRTPQRLGKAGRRRAA